MKRMLVILCSALLLALAAGCGSTSEPDAILASGKDKKLMFVKQKEGGQDYALVGMLKKLEFQVIDVPDNALNAGVLEHYDVVVVSDGADAAKVSEQLKNSPLPVVYLKHAAAVNEGLLDKQSIGQFKGKQIAIRNGSHLIASPMSDAVDVYSEEGVIHYAVPAKDAVVIASTPDNEQHATILAYEKGSKNINNGEVAGRRVVFFMPAGEEFNLNDTGRELFQKSVLWAAAVR